MRPEKKHALLRAVTILLLLGFLTLGGASAYIVFRHHDSLAASPTDEMYPFNDGWLLETEAGLVPVSLPSSVVPEGNAVTLLKRMEGDVLAPLTLQFSNYRQAMEIYADDELIFHINTTPSAARRLMVTGFFMAQLPNVTQSYTLKIVISGYQGNECRLPELSAGTRYAAVLAILSRELFTLLNIVLLGTFSILLLALALLYNRKRLRDYRLFFLAMMLLIFAAWGFSDSSLPALFHLNAEAMGFFSYLSFMLLPIAPLFFVWYSLDKKYPQLLYMECLGLGSVTAQIVLCILNVFSLQSMLFVNHLVIGLTLVISLLCIRKERKNVPEKGKLLRALEHDGVFLALSAAASISAYWIAGASTYRAMILTALSVFVLLLLYLMLVSYLDQQKKNQYRIQELQIYERLSVLDVLTSLGNRRAFEKRLAEVHETALEKKQDAVLLMLDLNGLKYTNDTFGHSAGDELIALAARAINTAYGVIGSCYRIGGDEFAVVVYPAAPSLNACHQRLESLLRQNNRKSSYQLSLARGESRLISKAGAQLSLCDWKREADVDMYRDKTLQHHERAQSQGREMRELIVCLIATEEAKDPCMAHHSEHVNRLSVMIARQLGLSEKTVAQISDAAQLHDIGEIGVSDLLRLKKSALNKTEQAEMRKHVQIGAQIIVRAPGMGEIAQIVLHHHERYDGAGYPDGLEKEDIPIGSRIIAIADSIDAMTSNRAFRKRLSLEECRREIEKNLGAMYDPAIGKIVLENWAEIEKAVQQRGDETRRA